VELFDRLGLDGGEVSCLRGIGRQVVELRNRQIDELLSGSDHTVERRPSAVQLSGQRLEIGRGVHS
jgi:hypothetical protein